MILRSSDVEIPHFALVPNGLGYFHWVSERKSVTILEDGTWFRFNGVYTLLLFGIHSSDPCREIVLVSNELENLDI